MFQNRKSAGQELARALAGRDFPDPVVLALPRGGVPVAFEVARALKAPLDLVMVRKIGAPGHEELAMGAVVNGDAPQIVVNEDVARSYGLGREEVEARAAPGLAEIARRRDAYLSGRATVPLAGRTAIVVDDGIATGATMRAALQAVRARGPARLVLAVPVAAPDRLKALEAEVDAAICLEAPQGFYAVGAHYRDFPQLDDDEVIRLMEEAGRP